MVMLNLSKLIDKIYLLAEDGSGYCSKKSDDLCADVCNQVILIPLFFTTFRFCFFPIQIEQVHIFLLLGVRFELN